jgi:hypothetical protein
MLKAMLGLPRDGHPGDRLRCDGIARPCTGGKRQAELFGALLRDSGMTVLSKGICTLHGPRFLTGQ